MESIRIKLCRDHLPVLYAVMYLIIVLIPMDRCGRLAASQDVMRRRPQPHGT